MNDTLYVTHDHQQQARLIARIVEEHLIKLYALRHVAIDSCSEMPEMMKKNILRTISVPI